MYLLANMSGEIGVAAGGLARMLWKQIAHLFLSVGLLATKPLSTMKSSSSVEVKRQQTLTNVSVEELLTYQCAIGVGNLVDESRQLGPLFAAGDLVFTSVEAKDQSKLLIVNAGTGIYALNLEKPGLNRIRFKLPDKKGLASTLFFLSYLHGESLSSRYFEFAHQRPSAGRDEFDYQEVTPQRAEYLLPQFEYAVYSTAGATLKAIRLGKLERSEISLNYFRKEDCDHLERRSPPLARSLQQVLQVVGNFVYGSVKSHVSWPSTVSVVGSRRPASLEGVQAY